MRDCANMQTGAGLMNMWCGRTVKIARAFGGFALATTLLAALFVHPAMAQEDKGAQAGPKVAKVEISPKEAKAEVGAACSSRQWRKTLPETS
jgi:hypothetical protein